MAGIIVMIWEGVSLGRIIGNVAQLTSALGFAAFNNSLRWQKLEDMMPAVFLGGCFAIIAAVSLCQIKGYGFNILARDMGVDMAMGIFQVGAGLILYTLGSKVVPSAELALLSMNEVIFGPF